MVHSIANESPNPKGQKIHFPGSNCQLMQFALKWQRVKDQPFSEVIAAGAKLQAKFPGLELIAVGGTAAAIHCHHRVSFDVDCVTPHLNAQFDQVVETLDAWDGWKTNRVQKPVIILGERNQVELGIRQLRRSVPLESAHIQGLRVATSPEALRIKAFLAVDRRVFRDFVDVAALANLLGEEAALGSLKYLNIVYPSTSAQTRITQFAEVCEMEPIDRTELRLPEYKGLQAPWNDWSYVQSACQNLARQLLRLELRRQLPSSLDRGFYEPNIQG